METATWANDIHTPEFLYAHRMWRFRQVDCGSIVQALSIQPGSSVIEIGCGPGALCRKIHEWVAGVSVLGFDNDPDFIAFAKKHVPDCRFVTADARDCIYEAADYVVSHTIMEYMPQEIFFPCVSRLLKPLGETLILSILPCSRKNDLIWKPQIQEVENAIAASGLQKDKSALISRQGYDDVHIVERLHSYGFEVKSIDYIPIITSVSALTHKEKMEYRRLAETYQHCRLKTQAGNLSKSMMQHLERCIEKHYDILFNDIEKTHAADVEIIRVIRAVKTGECT